MALRGKIVESASTKEPDSTIKRNWEKLRAVGEAKTLVHSTSSTQADRTCGVLGLCAEEHICIIAPGRYTYTGQIDSSMVRGPISALLQHGGKAWATCVYHFLAAQCKRDSAAYCMSVSFPYDFDTSGHVRREQIPKTLSSGQGRGSKDPATACNFILHRYGIGMLNQYDTTYL